MERTYEFKTGQRVKMKDPNEGNTVYGTVTDKTSNKVFILWEDIRDVCEHERDEFSKIHLA